MMTFETKLYRNFFVLQVENKKMLMEKGKNYVKGEEKVFINTRNIDENYCEMDLIWESQKEELSETINNDGEIIAESKILNEVNKAKVWIYIKDSNPFIFIFTNKINLLKDVQNILKGFLGIQTSNILFENEFFTQLLYLNDSFKVKTISYQTNDENYSSITLTVNNKQGSSLRTSNLFGEFEAHSNEITQITLIINNNVKVKIYQNSKFTIYNTASKHEIFETIYEVNSWLSNGGIHFA